MQLNNPTQLLKSGLIILTAAGCTRLSDVGQAPELTPVVGNEEYVAMSVPENQPFIPETQTPTASLWSGGQASLLGDRRAARRGDILTVVIQIDEKAEISNNSGRSRSGAESMSIPALAGIPQRLNKSLPEGASLDDAVNTKSASTFKGSGSVSRREKLTLRVAATVIDQLANGVLRIEGTQEVRVNFEVRELTVSGYVRPSDISRQNEITYDKIAGARISYGGRGQISDVQQPRLGQQVADVILPF